MLFSDAGLSDDGGGATGADTSMGLDGIGGGTVGEMLARGADAGAPTFRFTCISNSPTCCKVIDK